jgi:hypothetical protein
MTSSIDSNPEDEYADDEYADHDSEDREQPSTPADIPDEEPEEGVLEQRQEVPTARMTGDSRHSSVSCPLNRRGDVAGSSAWRGGAFHRGRVARRMARSACLPSWSESNRPRYRTAAIRVLGTPR